MKKVGLLILLITVAISLKSQTDWKSFNELSPIHKNAIFIQDYIDLDDAKLNGAIIRLNEAGNNFDKTSISVFKGYSDHIIDGEIMKLTTYQDKNSSSWIQLIKGDSDTLSYHWKKLGKKQYYSGITMKRNGCVYARYDSLENNIFNALFISEDYILSVGVDIPFPILPFMKGVSPDTMILLEQKLDLLSHLVDEISKCDSQSYNYVFKPSNHPLSTQERLFGFTQFWTEVKYNFAFFDQVPELDWDQVYYDYLPVVIADQSNVTYYRNMEKLCALLKDGHTNIFSPYRDSIHGPPVSLINIGGKAIVENMSIALKDKLPRGSEILSVNKISVQEHLENTIFPYISSSTDYIRLSSGIRKILDGPVNSELTISIKTPKGLYYDLNIVRNAETMDFEWANDWPDNPKKLEFSSPKKNVALIKLNSFSSQYIVKEFESILDTLNNFDQFIIDLRNNGGGSSNYGYDILKYFAHKPFLTSRWQTREHLASFKAWGEEYLDKEDEDLEEWALKAKQNATGDYWYISEPDTIQPEKKINFKGKIIVLIGNNTASAAEDFLVAIDGLNIATLVGQPTFGSTGQPLFIPMPRGGSARICTKKDTYPDGREFVGYGIQPDFFVDKTVKAFLQNKDLEMEKAMQLPER